MKWIGSRRVVLLLSCLTLGGNSVYAQRSPRFLEFGVSPGALVKPATRKSVGVNIGFGVGKNVVSAGASRTLLSDYEWGIGTKPNPNAGPIDYTFPEDFVDETRPAAQNPVANSTLDTFAVTYKRDLFTVHHRINVYGLGGIGYIKARATEHYIDSVYMVNPFFVKFCNCDASTYKAVPFSVSKSAQTGQLLLGAGLRIPLSQAFGFRVELTGARRQTTTSNATSPGVYLLGPDGNRIVVSQRALVVGQIPTNSIGPTLKSEVSSSVSFGIYYRLFNRHF